MSLASSVASTPSPSATWGPPDYRFLPPIRTPTPTLTKTGTLLGDTPSALSGLVQKMRLQDRGTKGEHGMTDSPIRHDPTHGPEPSHCQSANTCSNSGSTSTKASTPFSEATVPSGAVSTRLQPLPGVFQRMREEGDYWRLLGGAGEHGKSCTSFGNESD